VNTLVIITPAAELDLAEALKWYDSIRPGLSIDFRLAFDAAISRIGRYPCANGVIEHGLRRALLQRFSFAVFYRVWGEAVQVIAVLHTSRSPLTWQSRSR
jgi:plasmid stabilization system protein ParE